MAVRMDRLPVREDLHPDALVLAFDPSWACLGWSLGTCNGPLHTGHRKLPSEPAQQVKRRSRRPRAVRELLDELDALIADERVKRAGTGAPPPQVLIEDPPEVYQRGNQASVGKGLGRLLGMLELWAARPDWRPVWLVPTVHVQNKARTDCNRHGWRTHYRLKAGRGKGREALKGYAIKLVVGMGWEAQLRAGAGLEAGQPTLQADPEGPAGDVAEAMLIQVFGARHPSLGPDRGVYVAR